MYGETPFAPVNVIVGAASFSQTLIVPAIVAVGNGLTVIVKFVGVPTHPLTVGVIVIVPLIGVAPTFVPLKDPMLPAAPAPNPIAGLVLTQSYVVPATDPVKFTAVVGDQLQII